MYQVNREALVSVGIRVIVTKVGTCVVSCWKSPTILIVYSLNELVAIVKVALNSRSPVSKTNWSVFVPLSVKGVQSLTSGIVNDL